MCFGVSLWVHLVWALCASWTWISALFTRLGKFSAITCSNRIFVLFSLLLLGPLWCKRPYTCCCLKVPYTVLIIFNYIFFCSSNWAISNSLSSWSLSHSSLSPYLLLIPISVFFISVVVFLSPDEFFKKFLCLHWSYHWIYPLFCRVWWAFLWLLLWTLYWVDSLPPFYFILFLGFCLVFFFRCSEKVALFRKYNLGSSGEIVIWGISPLSPEQGVPVVFPVWTSLTSSCAKDALAGEAGPWPGWLWSWPQLLQGHWCAGQPPVWLAGGFDYKCW